MFKALWWACEKVLILRIIRDTTFDYPFIRANLGLSRMDVIRCNLKGECY